MSARRSRDWHGILSVGLFSVALLLACGLASAGYFFFTGDRIAPGVQVMGVDVGGLSTVRAATALEGNWLHRTIVLDAGGGVTTSVLPEILGITLDTDVTVRSAHGRARSWPSLLDMLLGQAAPVAPVLRLDRAVALQNLRALSPHFTTAPIDSGIAIVNGEARATPPMDGRAVDVVATVNRLDSQLDQVIAQGHLVLAMRPVAPAITDVGAMVEAVNRLLANPLSLDLYDPIHNETVSWTVPAQTWGSWLSLSLDPEQPEGVSLTPDRDQIAAYLATEAQSLGTDRYLKEDAGAQAIADALIARQLGSELRIYHREQQHVVQPGETFSSIARDTGIPYPWIQQANAGVGEDLFAGQNLTIPSPDVLLPLPVVRGKRIVVSLGNQSLQAFENGAVKWEWPVSTGIGSSPTAPGVFQIQSHEPNAYAANWDLWMPYFMGIYRPVPDVDFMNGFHGFPTRGGANLLWTGDLGHPVTFGCILVSSDNAAALYDWAEEGVVVEVDQ